MLPKNLTCLADRILGRDPVLLRCRFGIVDDLGGLLSAARRFSSVCRSTSANSLRASTIFAVALVCFIKGLLLWPLPKPQSAFQGSLLLIERRNSAGFGFNRAESFAQSPDTQFKFFVR